MVVPLDFSHLKKELDNEISSLFSSLYWQWKDQLLDKQLQWQWIKCFSVGRSWNQDSMGWGGIWKAWTVWSLIIKWKKIENPRKINLMREAHSQETRSNLDILHIYHAHTGKFNRTVRRTSDELLTSYGIQMTRHKFHLINWDVVH